MGHEGEVSHVFVGFARHFSKLWQNLRVERVNVDQSAIVFEDTGNAELDIRDTIAARLNKDGHNQFGGDRLVH